MDTSDQLLRAKKKDIEAFNHLFHPYEKPLKSYLYRLLTHRPDVEDFYHNTFLKAFEKIETFRGDDTQFKSWIFSIATRLVYNHLKREKKWTTNTQDVCRDSLVNDPDEQQKFVQKVGRSTHIQYEIKEHIDFCFTCINKTLPIEQQIAILLKDVLKFTVDEITTIMERTPGQVKHYLFNARSTLSGIYENRCALVNKNGTCHQCSELQGLFNPKSDVQRELMSVHLVKEAEDLTMTELFELREKIVQSVDPLNSSGADLHDHLMQHMKKVNRLI